MSIPEWEEIGIPNEYGPLRLLYNPPAETVIAELRSVGEEFLPNRIYTRHKDSAKYELLGEPDALISYESVATALARPLVFYNTFKLTNVSATSAGKREYAMDWDGLYSLELKKQTHSKIASKDALALPPPYSEGWVSSLVSVSDDGSELYLRVAVSGAEVSSGFRTVSYRLARMDLMTRMIDLISPLRGTFF